MLRQEFEARSDSLKDDDLNTNQECNIRSGFKCRTERRGWSRFNISQSQLEALNIDAGFRWNNIARILQVSSRTEDQLENTVRGVLQCTASAGFKIHQVDFNFAYFFHTFLIQHLM